MYSETLAAPYDLAEPREGKTLIDLVRGRALAHREKVAFRFVRDTDGEVRELTYRGLYERAQAIAAELQSRMAAGDRVLLVYPPGLEFVEAFFGCLLAGVVAVPVAAPGRRRPGAPLAAIRQSANPELVLTSGAFGQDVDWAEILGRSTRPVPWLASDSISTSRRLSWNAPRVDQHDTAFLQYTSGSTSAPKGVVLSHANLLANAAVIQRAFGTTTESRGVFWLPLYHDMGLIGGVIQPLFCGGSSTLLAPGAFLQRPALWLEEITRRRATISGGPDFGYDVCARKVSESERRSLDLSSLQLAFTGAERIRPKTLERFSAAFGPCGFRTEAFFPCYGLAEATLMVTGGPRDRRPTVVHFDQQALTQHEARETPADHPLSTPLVGCGVKLPGQRVVIVDPDTRRPCSDSQIGEIWVMGASVAQGYFEHPVGTAESFRGYLAESNDGPFLRTGDLGFLKGEQLFVTGRMKDLLILRGRNFYPEDIENSAQGVYSGLRPSCCVAVAVDEEETERLVIVQEVEPRQREFDSSAALRAIQRAISAQHDVEIDTILLVKAGEIPRTSSGKPRRGATRDRYLKGDLAVLASWKFGRTLDMEDETPPLTEPLTPPSAAEIEAWLTQRIASRLQLPIAEIRSTTPFLEFGMGSIDAVELASGLERWLGRRLSPTALYNHPNIAALAKWLSSPPAPTDATSSTSLAAQVAPLAPLDPTQCLTDIRSQSDDELAAFIQAEMAKFGAGPDSTPLAGS